jgi:hypothetical protein
MDGETRLGLLNLHDAFLTADLMQQKKWAAPVENDPVTFTASEHGRFERLWATFLYVLVEAWRSAQMAGVRNYLASVTSLDELSQLLKAGEADGSLSKMEQTRHYMCHRDRREYWDNGRLAVCGQLNYHMKLHEAFSKVLLAGFRVAEQTV